MNVGQCPLKGVERRDGDFFERQKDGAEYVRIAFEQVRIVFKQVQIAFEQRRPYAARLNRSFAISNISIRTSSSLFTSLYGKTMTT